MNRRSVGFLVAGLAVAVVLAVFVSPFASDSPDGLERVATDEGIIDQADEHGLTESPIADYQVEGVDNERVGTGIAGLIGVAVTFAVGLVVFTVVRMGRSRRAASDPA